MVINNRVVSLVEYSTERNWLQELPTKNWLCVLVINEKTRNFVEEALTKMLLQNVGWVCTIGEQCEWAHDLLDEEIVFREVESLYLPLHHVMTTWHTDFEEGLWFALFVAHSEEVAFQQVTILDMTKGKEQERIRTYLSFLEN